ncbi:MAG: hypothetical protein ACI9KE_005601 [Polyangiales bacterium]
MRPNTRAPRALASGSAACPAKGAWVRGSRVPTSFRRRERRGCESLGVGEFVGDAARNCPRRPGSDAKWLAPWRKLDEPSFSRAANRTLPSACPQRHGLEILHGGVVANLADNPADDPGGQKRKTTQGGDQKKVVRLVTKAAIAFAVGGGRIGDRPDRGGGGAGGKDPNAPTIVPSRKIKRWSIQLIASFRSFARAAELGRPARSSGPERAWARRKS